MGFKSLAPKGETGNSGLLSDLYDPGPETDLWPNGVSAFPTHFDVYLLSSPMWRSHSASFWISFIRGAMCITIELVHPIKQGNSEASYVTILVLSLKFILQLLIQRNL